MAIDLGPGLSGQKPARRSRLAWLTAGPLWMARRTGEMAGASEIRSGYGLLRGLGGAIRRGPARQSGPVADARGYLDPVATAFNMGITEFELEKRWKERRRQTARVAWGCFAAGWIALLLWVWQMVAMPTGGGGRFWAAVQFLPFCAAFFVLAFRNAWANWQLRTRRLAPAGAYLRTAGGFWPRGG